MTKKELTREEKEFIINLLSRVQVSPADPNAIKLITIIQEIISKLEEKENGTNTKVDNNIR